MTPTFTLKRGDLLPTLLATLQEPSGAPIDLTATTAIRFNMRPRYGKTLLGGACSISGDPASGRVQYTWQTVDTADTGIYYGEFELTWVGDMKQTVPSDGYFIVNVIEELDPP